ncbi:MAG: YqaE/Pmp3 family membrane protein [Halomonas sp.]|nr:YqaE/Pmp3 family membrane protein [Halomonas sp.]TVP42732.1 MAG: YqaE/Pmp3 family membrane protein [Halomonas sp.]
MDAREYLNRKGVSLDRDPDRPNTLEEKAWERARGAGQQRPKSGTPHDWEDWERHHDDLADGAETLEQKIDKEAHRLAQERAEKAAAESASSGVEHFTPPPKAQPVSPPPGPGSEQSQKVAAEPAGLKFAYQALAILLPPLAVGLTKGGGKRVMIGLILTLLGWVPGAVYAFLWVQRR